MTPLLTSPPFCDIDRALADMLARRWPGSEPQALRAAALASLAVQSGHLCFDANVAGGDAALALRFGLADDAAADARALIAAATDAPFAQDTSDPLAVQGSRLYLRRYLLLECEVAGALRARAAQAASLLPLAQLPALLQRVFPGSGSALAEQRHAVAMATQVPLLVLCGGPGTGKTYTLVRMLAAQLAASAVPLRIGLAAPTGKAATRLLEAVHEAAAALPQSQRLLASLPVTASTVHRLLGLRPYDTAVRHDQERPLPLDLLVVDECSMLDLPLFVRLLCALPPACRLILAGDPGQLPAVEGGAVFAAIARHGQVRGAGARQVEVAAALAAPVAAGADADALSDRVVELTVARRFAAESAVGALVAAIRRADLTAVRAALESSADELRWIPQPAADAIEAFGDTMVAGYAALHDAGTPREALAALARFRVLCALRDGPYGVGGLNSRIESLLLRGGAQERARAAQPVLIQANDATLGLYNGDFGVVMADARGELRAWFGGGEESLRSAFPGAADGEESLRSASTGAADGEESLRSASPGAADGEESLRSFALSQLPTYMVGFALTAHKAQGSEFEHVALVLPAQPHPLLTREWLYTAVSRARQRVTLFASWETIAAAVESRALVMSGLPARLAAAD